MLSAATVAMILTGCTKDDQKLANDLEGTWEVQSAVFTEGDQTLTLDKAGAQEALFKEITFNDCKVKDDDCGGSYVDSESDTYSFTYDVNEEGTQLSITEDGETSAVDVVEIDSDAAKFSITDTEDGLTVNIKFDVTKK